MLEIVDLRIVFLGLLFAFLIVFIIVFRPMRNLHLGGTLLRVLLGVLGAGLIVVFILLLTRTDPMPYVRWMAYYVGVGQLVEFEKAIPFNLAENLEVAKVEKVDTDADEFDEWVVLYRFDKGNPTSPIKGVIYDNDRGNPAIIFPYALNVPDRNYLSTNPSGLSGYPKVFLESVAQDQNGPDKTDIAELVVDSNTELSIFRFQQNSQPSEEPRDTPARYQTIGFFQGNGGTSLATNQNSGEYQVTVVDPTGYDRSQLAARAIYGLHWQTDERGQRYQTFLDPLPPLGNIGTPQLAAPVMSTVDFFPAPPEDVFNTPYPENIVLAFYTATCGREDDTLCLNLKHDLGWKPQDFLTGEAAGNTTAPGYFGLPSLSGNQNIQVSRLDYYPQVETETSRPTLTGEQPQASEVEITFTVNNGPQQRIRYGMKLVDGQWKIGQVIAPTNKPISQASCTITAPQLAQLNASNEAKVSFTVTYTNPLLAKIPPTEISSDVEASDYPSNPNSTTLGNITNIIRNATIDWGNGTSGGLGSGSGVHIVTVGDVTKIDNIEYTYNNASPTYEVKAKIGETPCLSAKVTINSCPPPTAQISPVSTPVLLCNGQAVVNFQGSGTTDPEHPITQYKWNFGDGAAEDGGSNVSHAYTQPGTYQATLTTVNNCPPPNSSPPPIATLEVVLPPPPPQPCGPPVCCW